MTLYVLLTFSVLGNLALAYLLWRSKKEPTPTYDAKILLHHLTRGSAVIRLECLDPEGLLYRRPV